MDRSERPQPPLDPEARRQLLLTRIAYEREALRRDITRVKAASTPAQLLRTAFGVRLKPGLFSGAQNATGPDGWFTTALAWLRRYRMVSTLVGTLFGSAAPLLRRGGGLRRIVMLAASAAAAFAAYQAWQRSRGGDDSGV
jgi:hypothetical protein